ncbi:MAG: hypothetical protein KF713_20660 [Turneriella sp.]|nr:hypothetical protein [Turneriella sp.]
MAGGNVRHKVTASVRYNFTLAFLTLSLFVRCNNYDLVAKLENPSPGETFTDRFYAFVSSWQTTGDMANQPYAECSSLTGLSKVDCACTKAAAAGNLRKHSNHEFKAFLGLAGSPAYNPPCRSVGYPAGCSTNIAATWYNTRDGVLFNTHTPSSFSTALQNPIKFTEQKADINSGTVWTGSSALGGHTNQCPGEWAIADATTVNVGDLAQSSTAWEFNGSTQACNTQARIYCFATSPP